MQDLKEIEIVIVDDCSSDKSVKIINNFRKRDKRIILINNKKNMGSLYSRAIGGNIAKGYYFIFFDSDDINIISKKYFVLINLVIITVSQYANSFISL